MWSEDCHNDLQRWSDSISAVADMGLFLSTCWQQLTTNAVSPHNMRVLSLDSKRVRSSAHTVTLAHCIQLRVGQVARASSVRQLSQNMGAMNVVAPLRISSFPPKGPVILIPRTSRL